MSANIFEAIAELKAGKPIIMVDDECRENEGDLIFPAETITPEIMNFMIRNGTGIVCLAMSPEWIDRLGLPLMVDDHSNTSRNKTAFTVSIEAKQGVSTGVSAADRAQTVLTAIKEGARPEDLARPGHIFPLRAREMGVLERPGHTEGAIDLVKLAGFKPAGVICELMNSDGSMTRGQALIDFAKKHELKVLSIAELIAYRLKNESSVDFASSAKLMLDPHGSFTIKVFVEKISGVEHVALISDKPYTNQPVVRVHSSCLTGDVFCSLRCDCRKQLEYGLAQIASRGGVLVYLSQEGRGIGLASKIKAYALQEQGMDTVEANKHLGLPEDNRHYWSAAHILKSLGISDIKLLTNNPHKIRELTELGIHVEHESVPSFVNQYNRQYLLTKLSKLGHLLNGIQ